jgi:hypothetical protein
MTGVPVVATSVTTVNSTSFAFSPTSSTSTTVTGTVTPTTATVRALQSLTGGPTIEVAWASVDADTGLFEAVLPDEAPASTAYVANATTAYVFTPDAAIAGLYTLQAALEGATPQSQPIDTGALPPSILFSFP